MNAPVSIVVDGRPALALTDVAPTILPTKHGLSIVIYRGVRSTFTPPEIDHDDADRRWLEGERLDTPEPVKVVSGIELRGNQITAYRNWVACQLPGNEGA